MNHKPSLLLRAMALLSMATFVALIAVSIVAFVTQRQFLRASPIINALEEANAYERAPGILAELLVASLEGERSGLAQLIPLPALNRADTELFLAALLPRTWLQSQSEIVVQRAVAGLNGEAPRTPAVISLAEVKAQLNGPAGREALLAVIASRPACGPTDLSAFTCGFNLAGEIACRPPALGLDLCSAAIDVALGGLVSQAPDAIDLDAALQLTEPFATPLRNHARGYARAITLLGTFGWLAALPFFGLGTLLAVRSVDGLLRWWGAPLAGVGLALLPVIGVTVLWPQWYIAGPLRQLSAGAPALAALLNDVAGVLSRGMVLQLLIFGALFVLAGIGMLMLSFLIPVVRRWIAQG